MPADYPIYSAPIGCKADIEQAASNKLDLLRTRPDEDRRGSRSAPLQIAPTFRKKRNRVGPNPAPASRPFRPLPVGCGGGPLILPEPFETIRRQRCIALGAHDAAMAKVALDSPRIMTVVGELVACAVP
jgi:hypothetical protein